MFLCRGPAEYDLSLAAGRIHRGGLSSIVFHNMGPLAQVFFSYSLGLTGMLSTNTHVFANLECYFFSGSSQFYPQQTLTHGWIESKIYPRVKDS